MRLDKPYKTKQYAELAVYCNANNMIIEDKGDYLEAVAQPEPSIEEQNETLRRRRSDAFSSEADPLRYDWEELAARSGADTPEAEEAKQLWLAKKTEIRNRYQYIEDSE